MNKQEIMNMIQETFDGLTQSELLKEKVEIDRETVLIGPGAALNSIAFVTLFTDLEDRLSELAGDEVYLLIDEVHAFNPEKQYLTVGVLVDYIENMLKEA